jgi:hypothetical protein
MYVFVEVYAAGSSYARQASRQLSIAAGRGSLFAGAVRGSEAGGSMRAWFGGGGEVGDGRRPSPALMALGRRVSNG